MKKTFVLFIVFLLILPSAIFIQANEFMDNGTEAKLAHIEIAPFNALWHETVRVSTNNMVPRFITDSTSRNGRLYRGTLEFVAADMVAPNLWLVAYSGWVFFTGEMDVTWFSESLCGEFVELSTNENSLNWVEFALNNPESMIAIDVSLERNLYGEWVDLTNFK